jgi:tetratricopeptide (TPR) repeat protein
LTETEWKEHVRNFKSLGVQNPLVNFNFVTNQTGSFERLRMDVSSDQTETSSSATGFLALVDFSQNNLHWSGSFPATSSIIVPQLFQYSLLSPKFDVGATTDKVRVRSFQDFSNVQSSSYAQVAPVYALEPSERPQDNTRFTIDFSIVDALDQDIINIFASLDVLDNIIGNPELVFSPDYPDLENLRSIYFNRLTDMVNLKGFFEFYKWFDTNLGQFIAQLVPRKTKFLGTNFVIESHLLAAYITANKLQEATTETNVIRGLKATMSPDNYATFSRVLRVGGAIPEAIKVLQEAIDHYPEEAGLYSELSNLYQSINDKPHALEYATKAAAIDPQYAPLLDQLKSGKTQ